jgi:hypothetical protein
MEAEATQQCRDLGLPVESNVECDAFLGTTIFCLVSISRPARRLRLEVLSRKLVVPVRRLHRADERLDIPVASALPRKLPLIYSSRVSRLTTETA